VLPVDSAFWEMNNATIKLTVVIFLMKKIVMNIHVSRSFRGKHLRRRAKDKSLLVFMRR